MPQLRLALLMGGLAFLIPATEAAAQGPATPPSFRSIVATVVKDPSVYAPAAAKYGSMQLDWSSSQIFFRHGFIERNKRFTVSGRWNDTPLSYGDGNKQIALHAGMMLGWWMTGNIAERTLEKILTRRFESRRKLVRVVGQTARFSGATFFSYSSSIGHLRQWRRNETMARQLAFK